MIDPDLLAAHPARRPDLRLLWTATVKVGETEQLGQTPLGTRSLVPILGGQFEEGEAGPGLSGEVLPGGADRQLLRPDGIKELHALYEMRVRTGEILTIDNRVTVDRSRAPDIYAMSVITCHAPEGRFDWLGRRVILGTLQSLRPQEPWVIIRAWCADMGA